MAGEVIVRSATYADRHQHAVSLAQSNGNAKRNAEYYDNAIDHDDAQSIHHTPTRRRKGCEISEIYYTSDANGDWIELQNLRQRPGRREQLAILRHL
ncbi:MAG: hypothetical protein R2911_37445 [Caldilineaceae bacterium]